MARRSFSVFSLSFLDVMACGLGATILFLMIISAQVRVKAERANEQMLAQASLLEQQVLDGRKNLLRLRDEAERTERVATGAAGEITRLQALITELKAKLEAQAEAGDSSAKKESIEQLRADVQRLEEGKRRLAEAKPSPAAGQRVRSFVGEGNRQYLTGMKMGGRRVVILVDASASMLARTYVNVVRYRAMPESRRLKAPKWQQVVASVDWITTQIAPGTQFQIYVFNEQARSVIPGTEGSWLEVKTAGDLDKAVAALRQVVPEKGTSLHAAFAALGQLKPAPDNIYLLTDGLPTQGKSPPERTLEVRPDQRAAYFNQAARELPARVPVNVLLYPMDGDPDAAGFFWQLAMVTRGSFLTPSRDWP
jgi:hypothetical protein